MIRRTEAANFLGRWLKQRRGALQLTQDALAERVGCTASMLQKIEQGVRRPSPDMLERFAEVFSLSPEERAEMLRLSNRPIDYGQHNVAIAHDPHRAAAPGDARSIATAPPMLLTKILPPPSRQTVVRSRLITQLSSEDHGSLTLVVAPAGWGKTTLLTSWIASRPRPAQHAAWVALDERDTDVLLVLRYIIAALQCSFPAVGDAALDLLNTPQPSVESILTLIINDVMILGTPLVLVLDDYHLVRTSAIHNALLYLIEHLPPNLHLVIASREDPPFPLTRLRARQQLHEIRAADLRFTSDEAAAFFSDVMGLALPDHDIRVLEQRTEGWITGLQLAALAMRQPTDHGDFVRSFTGNHRLVLDYLAEEVLAHLPQHLHEFLLRTSILDRLCGPLCDTVLGLTTNDGRQTADQSSVVRGPSSVVDAYSQLILDELERANLFLVPLDDQRLWYRYHHLFGAVLRERLRRGVPAEVVAGLHQRAAHWYEAQRLPLDAIHHALAGGDWERAVRLIEQIGGALLQSGAINRLQELIESLPQAIRHQHPRLLYLLGRCARQVYNIVAARTLLEQAVTAFEASGDAVGRGDSLILLADCHRILGAYAEASSALAEALNGPLPPARRAAAMFSRAYEAAAVGDWRGAITTLNTSLDLLEQSGDQQALYDQVPNISTILLLLPNGIGCADRARQLIARASVAPLSLLHATDLFFKGVVQFVRGNLTAACSSLEQAVRLHEQLGTVSQTQLETMVWYARCAALLGDFTSADYQMDRLIGLLEQPALATFRQLWGAIEFANQGWLRWVQERYDEARASAREAEALANSQEWSIIGRVRRLLQGLLLIAEAKYTAAEALLQEAYAAEQQFRDSSLFADPGLLLAYLYVQTRHETDALPILDRVLATHEQDGTPGLILLTGGPVVVPLLRLAVAHQVHAPFASRTLRMLPDASQLPPSQAAQTTGTHTAANPDALTAREREVLRLIADGASNSEIAERLIISIATVKKHINNIFAKLDADSRTQALVRARERGLL